MRFILTEAALLAGIGPLNVRVEQIRHLKRLVASGQADVGVIDSKTLLSVVPPPAFYLFDRRVYLELPHGDLWLLSRSHAFDTYRKLFDVLAGHATFGAGAKRKLDSLLDRARSGLN